MHYPKIDGFSHLQQLSPTAKEAYLKTLSLLAHIDQEFAPCEKDFILTRAEELGIAANDSILYPEAEEAVLKELKNIKDRQARLEIIKSLCLLSHADDELSDSEILFIGRVGSALDISPEKTEEIIDWIIEYDIWQERGKIIFEDYCSHGEK